MYGPAFVALHIPFPSWIRTLLPFTTIGRYLTSIPTVVIGWYLLAKDSNLSQVQMKLTSNIQPQVDQLTQNQCKRSSWECQPIHLHPNSWCVPTQLHHYTAPWQQKPSRITVLESRAYCDQVHDELYLVLYVVCVGSGGKGWADMGAIALHSRSCSCTSVWVCEYIFKNWIPDSLTCHQLLVHKGNCFH